MKDKRIQLPVTLRELGDNAFPENVLAQNVRVGVAVIIRNEHDEILVGRRQGSHGAGTWTVPGGHLEFGEFPEVCAFREVWEETGLLLKAVSRPFASTNDIFIEEQKHYITLWVEGVIEQGAIPRNMEPEKCDGWEWFAGRDIPEPRFLGLKNLMAQHPAFQYT
jgi:8-oxo-dGTP diphosphatase